MSVDLRGIFELLRDKQECKLLGEYGKWMVVLLLSILLVALIARAGIVAESIRPCVFAELIDMNEQYYSRRQQLSIGFMVCVENEMSFCCASNPRLRKENTNDLFVCVDKKGTDEIALRLFEGCTLWKTATASR